MVIEVRQCREDERPDGANELQPVLNVHNASPPSFEEESRLIELSAAVNIAYGHKSFNKNRLTRCKLSDRFSVKLVIFFVGGISMKKLINAVDAVEEQMILGLVKSAPDKLRKLDCGNVVVRAQKKSDNKVALVSGGGSGHEPAHGGFVGEGMLDCAVAGAVFTSPTPDKIFEGIQAVATEAGVLCIVKNYTGDVLNFEMAMDMASDEDIKVDHVVVNDDVAVQDSLYTTGRRGVAGTVLVHKIAGAKAETGATLEEVKAVAEKVIANVRTMGMAISPCTVPAAGKPGFELADDEIEIGIGIHGEPGTHRDKIASADEIAKTLLDKILADIDYKGQEVVVLVNGMGATPLMELYIINNFVQDYLKAAGVKVYDTMVGNYMTSIEMAGFSLTLLRLDDELKKLYDAPADTPALKR